MTDNQFTTIRVLRSDLDDLGQLYGMRRDESFHKAVRDLKALCLHPEKERHYLTTTAWVPESGEVKSVSGFYCAACKKYTFQTSEVEAEPVEGGDVHAGGKSVERIHERHE